MLYNKNIGNIPQSLENDMLVAQYLKDLAVEAVETGRPLPAGLGESPFFVSTESDPKILLHEAITVNGEKYSIGTMKSPIPDDDLGNKPNSS